MLKQWTYRKSHAALLVRSKLEREIAIAEFSDVLNLLVVLLILFDTSALSQFSSRARSQSAIRMYEHDMPVALAAAYLDIYSCLYDRDSGPFP